MRADRIGCPEAGRQEIVVPRKGNRPARTAQLSIRYSKVILAPPAGKRTVCPSLSGQFLPKRGVPEGIEPLRWLLLTAAPADSFSVVASICHGIRNGGASSISPRR